ncbi:M13 family metallopeptidase [Photorhabdus bodei]|uniref:Peptidase M13 n=1 Tax=Photorhabdus bodei TaxID=2029681 RepID=A0A329XAP7_9GAMM|nr:M13 family metallopeptidase [Photorhabdus bodei]NDL00802.1 hypothetical protein [Photorhabdus bodei]NDL04968.1 hypothetical protein [Photorhabdus bodei]NDL09301.1 hypothetical protein [Photorhabdus bodei]RAX13585.1 hypothetical protein CKY02_05570 [Photorhabdus bodei]
MLYKGNDIYCNYNYFWLSEAKAMEGVSYRSTFTELRDVVHIQLREMLDDIVRQPVNENEVLIRKCYEKFQDIDTWRIDAVSFFKTHMDNLTLGNSRERTIPFILGRWTAYGVEALFRVRVVPWEENTRVTCLRLESADFMMPGEEYYTSNEPFYTEVRHSWFRVVEQILSVLDDPQPLLMAREIFQLERELVSHQFSVEEKRNPRLTCNTVLPTVFKSLTHFDLVSLCSGLKAPEPEKLVLESLPYAQAVGAVLVTKPVEVLEAYFKVRFCLKYRDFFSKLDTEGIAHFLQNITGAERKRPSEISAPYAHLISLFDDYLSQLYTERYTAPQTLDLVQKMVREIMVTFSLSIQQSTWMSDIFKARALRKIAAIRIKIGTPPPLTSYGCFTELDNLFDIVLAIKEAKFKHLTDCLNGSFNSHLWDMYGHEVNACYNHRKNEIILPAAVLQPPLLWPQQSANENYGGIGIIIAHEISHALDDEGCYFDEHGNLNMLWTQEDEQIFNQTAARIANFFSKIEVLPGHFIDGVLTRGECLADLSGCDIAWRTLCRLAGGETLALQEQFQNSVLLLWREYASEEIMHRLLSRGPHAPARFRALGCLHYLAGKGSNIEVSKEDIQGIELF